MMTRSALAATRSGGLLLVLLLGPTLVAAPAQAQDPGGPMPDPGAPPLEQPLPAPPPEAAPPPGRPPSRVILTPMPGPPNERWILEQLLKQDPEFRAAKRTRLAGILVTSIGGGGGLVFAAIFGLTASTCRDVSYYCTSSGCRSEGNACESDMTKAAIGSLIFAGASLAVGIPLWASGQSRMNEVRARRAVEIVPQLSFAVEPRGGSLGASWAF